MTLVLKDAVIGPLLCIIFCRARVTANAAMSYWTGRIMSGRRLLSLLPVFLCLLSSFALAQTSLSGAVAGTARDAQQAAIVHAQITLKNLESGESFAGVTGNSGAFRVEGLKPGSYALTAASPGFADFGPLPVTVEVGRITELSIHFAV